MLRGEDKRINARFNEIDLLDYGNLQAFLSWAFIVIKRHYEDRVYILDKTEKIKAECLNRMRTSQDDDEMADLYDMYWQTVLFEAQHRQFDSFCLYMEKNREVQERFYEPRRACFMKIGLVQAIQKILDDELDLLSISLPPGTGKTTLEKFLHAGAAGWFHTLGSLFYSHSGEITRMYYDGVYQLVTGSDYTWATIFPNLRVTYTNAKSQQFNVGGYKAFPSVQCTSVDSKNAGKVRASKFLFVDDMIGGIEEALNKATLDKLWEKYSVDALQRKMPGAKEIHIATRWSVHDVIGRLKQIYEGNPRAMFISVPDIDPQTGKSNFNFAYNGFDEEFYHRQAMVMDEISYRCLYKNEPIEREGLLYHEEELRTFFQLPEKEPDAILAVCDTKTTGSDYMFMPIMYQYGEDYYLDDCICDNSSDFGLQYARLSKILLDHNVQRCEFESNAGGSRVAYEVDQLVEAAKGRCSITTKQTQTNKETRIIVNADWIKKHVLFLEKEKYAPQSDYGRMMSFLLSYSQTGKNAHDDVPDGLSNFVLFVTQMTRVSTATIMSCPF